MPRHLWWQSLLSDLVKTNVPGLLNAACHGDSAADVQLSVELYGQLRRIAAAKMAHEQPGQTIQPTALVHEAWLRLVDDEGRTHFTNRAHFFGSAAEAMRRILVDRARRRQAVRHGGGQCALDIAEIEIVAPTKDDGELLALHEALEELAKVYPRQAELVKLRYFAGFTMDAASTLLGISVPTAKRDWTFAKAWLYRAITQSRLDT
jgi:RNA polymerase sigma factor (TIGR02999 family)